jgi:hypothetical protein
MDASVRKDEARVDAFDEAVWSRHPDAGVKLASLAVSAFGPTRRAGDGD